MASAASHDAWSAYYQSNPHAYPYAAYSAQHGYAGAQQAWPYPAAAPAAEPAPPPPDSAPPGAADESAPPPLPAEDGPPGASSDTSAGTQAAWPAESQPPSTASPAAADPHEAARLAAWQQYYAQHGYPTQQAYTAAPATYPSYNSYQSYPQPAAAEPAAYAGYTSPAEYAGQGSASGSQQAGAHTPVSSAPAPAAVPGPRPPPGSPPRSGNASRQNSMNTYNAVPPPGSLAPHPSSYRGSTFSIRPNKPGYTASNSHHNAASYAARPAAQQATAYAAPQATSYAASQAAASPAYVRAGSASAPNKPAAASGKPGQSQSKFPPTFSAWVERCFGYCRNDTERQAMTSKLSEKIKALEASNSLWLVDWDKEPLPYLRGGEGGQADSSSLQSPSSQQGGLRSKRSRWEESSAAQPQWGSQNKKQGKKQRQGDMQAGWSKEQSSKLAQRAGRFGDGGVRARQGSRGWRDDDCMDEGYSSDDDGYSAAAAAAVQGTCTNLEKSYFRLTGPPDPREVRPPNILKKALDRLVGMLRGGDPRATMFYVLDQFKGMRQDCTVQHLRNALAVEVYEAHGRQSLEYGDLAEFNQCQTQLAGFYADGAPGCVAEFAAYKLLYNMVHARAGGNQALLQSMRAALTQVPSTRATPPATPTKAASSAAASSTSATIADPDGAIANALAAREAFGTANYPAFFRAYAAAPNLSRAILDALAPHVRWSALNVLVKSYKTALPLSFVARALGFVATKGATPVPQPAEAAAAQAGDGGQVAAAAGQAGGVRMPGCRQEVYVGKAAAAATEEEGVAECAEWLRAHGAVVEEGADGSLSLDVKASMGQLFIPEETSKVTHGDENLSVEDFLSRLAK